MVAAAGMLAAAAPAAADPVDPIPGNGFSSSEPISLRACTARAVLWDRPGECGSTACRPRTRCVVHPQHARSEQGPRRRDEYLHRPDVREHQPGGEVLRVAQLSALDPGALSRLPSQGARLPVRAQRRRPVTIRYPSSSPTIRRVRDPRGRRGRHRARRPCRCPRRFPDMP